MPSEKYSGSEDPISHLDSFVHQMEIQNATQSAMCKMFPSNLTDYAETWFRKLPPGSVDYFTKLTRDFCAQFQGIKPRPKDLVLLQNLWAGRLFLSFAKHPPETYQEAYNRALEHVEIEEQLRIKIEYDEAQSAECPKKEVPKPISTKKVQNLPPNRSAYRPPNFSQHRDRYLTRRSSPRTPPLREVARITGEEDGYNHYTPLKASRETIYLAIRYKGLLRKPGPMKAPVDRRNRYECCDFYEDVGHNTSECYSLRNQIEGLVRGGLLIEFLQQVQDSIKMGKEVQGRMQEAEERWKDEGKDLMQQIQLLMGALP
ncbi:hypothetical protein LWI28_028702 [Acer negundo]|uniref:Retrotransposon gag domain-containing protein n=1 Tax=Acer negundo TaxID=4023 RepID=A0AAD5NWI5_ACENE|nr:hypothetical protein LWI28_028702 [Acer negundo]